MVDLAESQQNLPCGDLRVQWIYEGFDETNLATTFQNLRTGETVIGQLD